MRVIARKTLNDFWRKHADAEGPLRAWFAEVAKARWSSPASIKAVYASASIINNETVVFNIGGNKYRLIVKVWWAGQTVWIKFVGTHKAYNSVDVANL